MRFTSFSGVCLQLLALVLPCRLACADAVYKWPELSAVKRIAIVPAYLCANSRLTVPDTSGARDYQAILNRLAATVDRRLAVALSTANRFTVLPLRTTSRTLSVSHWTNRDLFFPFTNATKTPWPAINQSRISLLARRLHADGVLLAIMREPASIGDGMKFYHDPFSLNVLNWSLKRNHAHVLSPRLQGILLTREGIVAWKDDQMCDHPRTSPHTMRTLEVDWQEATEGVAQQLVDSLLRLPPP